MISKKKYYQLVENSFFFIEGKDRVNFLQGLTSNDIYKVSKNQISYSAILSPQGKFFFDFFITDYKSSLLIECNKNVKNEFIEKLSIYKLKSDIDIKNKEIFNSYLLSSDDLNDIKELEIDKLNFFFDPRFKKKFLKVYCNEDYFNVIKENLNLTSLNEKQFEYLRIKNTVPNFKYDSDRAKSTLLELRFDELNGVDWEKGCYMGQELTARTKYRGTIKRKIFGIKIDGKIIDSKIYYENINIGELKSFCDDYGIAILKTNEVEDCIKLNKKLTCKDANLIPFIPKW